MLEKSKAMKILETALAAAPADQTEAVLIAESTTLTRFTESVINQNIMQEQTRLLISSVTEKRVGLAVGNDLSPEGIKEIALRARDVSRLQSPDERFVSFPGTDLAPTLKKSVVVESNLKYGPKEMAEVVAYLADATGQKGLTATGALRHDLTTVAVANSLGVRQYGRAGKGELSLTAVGPGEQSGYAISFNPDPSTIDFRSAAERAIDKALRNVNPVVLPDGQYTVILEPAAVGQLLLFLSFMGFGGKTVMQKRSFISEPGQIITGENITITDEPDNPVFGGLLFDFEGVPRQKLIPIDHGRAGSAAYDSYYATAMGIKPTGHALPPDNGFGPYPKNLAIAVGDHTVDEMIASTEKGVLITHFWYLNYLNPMKTMITGTTFDGTFLIENGRLGPAIRNMRANQSILEAFSHVEMISKERIVYPQFASLMLVPAMKINNFNLVQETPEEWEGKC